MENDKTKGFNVLLKLIWIASISIGIALSLYYFVSMNFWNAKNTVFKNQTPPESKILEPLSPFPKAPLKTPFLEDWQGILIKDLTPVFENISSTGKALNPTPQFKNLFGALVYIYATYPSNGRTNKSRLDLQTMEKSQYLLVGQTETKGQCLGWVARKNILLRRTALKTHNRFYRKILPTNTYFEKSNSKEVSLYADPDSKSRVVNQTTMLAPLFVYEQEVSDQKDLFYNTDVWLLIGKENGWKPGEFSENQSTIVGWINQSETYSWTTRLGLELDKSTFPHRSPIRLFESLKDLKRFYSIDHRMVVPGYESKSPEEFIAFEQRPLILDFNKFKIKGLSISAFYIAIPGGIDRVGQAGWIADKDIEGRNQARVMVYVAKPNLFEFVGFLTSLLYKIEDGEQKHIVQRLPILLANSLEMYTGDKFNHDESLYEFCSKRLPAPLKSPLLYKEPDELYEVCQRDLKECRKLLKSIRRSKEYLSGIIANCKMHENSYGDPECVRNKNGECLEEKYWVKTSSGLEYAWIPFSYFP